MIINNVSLVRYKGVMEVEGVLCEDRLATPLDIYEQYANSLNATADFVQSENGKLVLDQIYVKIETEDNQVGIAGPMNDHVAFIIANTLKVILINRSSSHIVVMKKNQGKRKFIPRKNKYNQSSSENSWFR